MSDEELKQVIAELQEVVRCRCDEAYRDRGLKDPQCECDSAEAVKVVARRIEQLAVTNEQLVATNEALTEQLAAARKDVDEVEAYAWELEQRLPTSEKLAAYRATIEETSSHNKGENHD